MLIMFSLSFIQIPNRNFEIIMFDVGNADSFLIKTPNSKYFLIDTAKLPYKGISNAEAIINKYFKNKRINNLETLIITHFDSDHAGGTIDILNKLKVKNIFLVDNFEKSMLSKNIKNYLDDNKVNYKIAQNNDTFYIEKNLKITNFAPKITSKSKDKENEESIVTLIEYNNKNFLFMADCGIEGYNSIKNYLPNKIDVLKVGHHGAKNVINQEMINKLKPDYALISTGVNKFNHPHYETIEILEKNNIKIISSRDYGFTKIIYNKRPVYLHYNSATKKNEQILFNKIPEIPFHKTEFMKNLLKEKS